MPVRRRAALRFCGPAPSPGLPKSCRAGWPRPTPAGSGNCGWFPLAPSALAVADRSRCSRSCGFRRGGTAAPVSPGHAVAVGGACRSRSFVSALLFGRSLGTATRPGLPYCPGITPLPRHAPSHAPHHASPQDVPHRPAKRPDILSAPVSHAAPLACRALPPAVPFTRPGPNAQHPGLPPKRGRPGCCAGHARGAFPPTRCGRGFGPASAGRSCAVASASCSRRCQAWCRWW